MLTWEDDVEVHALRQRGWTISAIARNTGFDRKTVRKHLAVGGNPGVRARPGPARFDPIDVGVLHLGGTWLPAGRRLPFGLTVAMDGRQGAQLVSRLNLSKMIPVHLDDYGVFASPLANFTREMARRGIADRIRQLNRGAPVTV